MEAALLFLLWVATGATSVLLVAIVATLVAAVVRHIRNGGEK